MFDDDNPKRSAMKSYTHMLSWFARNWEYFCPEFNIRLYDKNSESYYFFFLPPKSEFFFQQHWESEYFFLDSWLVHALRMPHNTVPINVRENRSVNQEWTIQRPLATLCTHDTE
jgi:hypothetical protein